MDAEIRTEDYWSMNRLEVVGFHGLVSAFADTSAHQLSSSIIKICFLVSARLP